LEGLLGPQDDLLSIACAHARDVDALCDDVASIIFPSAVHTPSEATISAVSVKLLQIVRDIEARLHGATPESTCGPLLARSGFLRKTDIVDFALVRVAEDNLIARLGCGFSQLAVELLDHADTHVIEAAQALLAADSLQVRSQGRSYLTLPPDALSNPHHAGVYLFVAYLSADLNIGHDHILRLIGFESAFPMKVMLAAAGFPEHAALQTMIDLRSQKLSVREAALFEAEYTHFIPEMARQQICDWSSARSLFLSSGRT